MRGVCHQQVVTIRRRLGDHFRSDHAAGPRPVIDDHPLIPRLCVMDGQGTCEDVGGTPGCNRHDNAYGPARITLGCDNSSQNQSAQGYTDTEKNIHSQIVICSERDSR